MENASVLCIGPSSTGHSHLPASGGMLGKQFIASNIMTDERAVKGNPYEVSLRLLRIKARQGKATPSK